MTKQLWMGDIVIYHGMECMVWHADGDKIKIATDPRLKNLIIVNRKDLTLPDCRNYPAIYWMWKGVHNDK